jgi:predicted permease
MFEHNAIQAIAILIGLIFLGMGLRHWGILKEEHGGIFARIITTVTIPALIFSSLSTRTFSEKDFQLAGVMIGAQLGCALLAAGISTILKLSRPRKGALILASTFTSSAFLGYAVVREVYKNNPEAMADAAIVSELGVATLLFTFGVFVAMHYGNNESSGRKRIKEMVSFFYSPIFITLVLAILFSYVPISHDRPVISSIYEALGIIADSNTFLVALTVGVMLYFRDLKKVWIIVLIAVCIKLIIQPLLASEASLLFHFPTLWHQIVVLQASMPTAAMTAIFAKKYGCDAELTTILIFATFISSCLTMFMMIILLA